MLVVAVTGRCRPARGQHPPGHLRRGCGRTRARTGWALLTGLPATADEASLAGIGRRPGAVCVLLGQPRPPEQARATAETRFWWGAGAATERRGRGHRRGEVRSWSARPGRRCCERGAWKRCRIRRRQRTRLAGWRGRQAPGTRPPRAHERRGTGMLIRWGAPERSRRGAGRRKPPRRAERAAEARADAAAGACASAATGACALMRIGGVGKNVRRRKEIEKRKKGHFGHFSFVQSYAILPNQMTKTVQLQQKSYL